MRRRYVNNYGRPRLAGLVLFLALAILGAVAFDRFQPPRRSRVLDQPVTLTGSPRIVDGDSIRLGGEEIRLKGIDAPELHQTCRRGPETVECGLDARRALAGLFATAAARCDANERDRFGRLLARCLVAGQDVGEAMVRAGQAVAFGAYFEAESEARRARRGLWSTDFQRPADWRAEHPR